MMTKRAIADLHKSYRKWAGEPFSISTFRRDRGDVGKFNSLDILCYRSEDADHLRSENEFTFLATAGLSCLATRAFEPPCELIWRIAGRRMWEEIQKLSETLAKIAVFPFYGKGMSFIPGTVLQNLHFPVFEQMHSLLIAHLGIRGEEHLPATHPPVSLYWIKPLYDAEVNLLQELGHQEFCATFGLQGIDWDNPERSPLRLPQAMTGGDFRES